MKINGVDISKEKKAEIQAELLKIDGDTMADWLWRALMSVYKLSEPETPKVITLDYFGSLDIESDVVATFGCVYLRFMPATAQALFRQTLGHLLRNHCNDPNAPIQAFRDLIYLIVLINATESLDALLPALGNGGIGKRHPEIVYYAIAILAPTIGDKKKMTELMESQNFKEDIYLSEVIKVFVKCDKPFAMDIVQNYINIFSHRYEDGLERAKAGLYKKWVKNVQKLTQSLTPDK